MLKVPERLPGDLIELYMGIKNEVIWLHGKWIIYRQIYGTRKERIDLLNECGPTVFRVFQDLFHNGFILTLSVLTDPHKTRDGKENRCLELLINRLNRQKDSKLIKELKSRLKDLRDKCSSLRETRNKWIAHKDLNTALRVTQKPLRGFTRTEVEDILKAVRDFMNKVEVYFGGTQMAYDHFLLQSDGDSMIQLLKEAMEYRYLIERGKLQRTPLRNRFKDA